MTMSDDLTYAAAGVSLDAADAVVERLKGAVRSTNRPGVIDAHGGFAGLLALGGLGFAANQSVEEIRQHLGADSLAYLSLDGLEAATGHGDDRYCRACLTGEYPTIVPLAADKERFEATQLPVA